MMTQLRKNKKPSSVSAQAKNACRKVVMPPHYCISPVMAAAVYSALRGLFA